VIEFNGKQAGGQYGIPIATKNIMIINVILADHQRVYRIGMAGALAAEDDIRIVGQPHSVAQLMSSLEKFRAHVLVLSSAFLGKMDEIKQIAARQHTAILLLEDSGAWMPSRSSHDIDGVMQRSANESTAVRCIRHLARGGRVLRLARHHHPIEVRQDSVGLRVRERLSQIDLRIIALVVQGCKNREIALHMGTTEHGIKNSLRKIFDKTGVFDRLELALFVLHHGILIQAAGEAYRSPGLNSVAAFQSFQDMGYRRTVN